MRYDDPVEKTKTRFDGVNGRIRYCVQRSSENMATLFFKCSDIRLKCSKRKDAAVL